MERKETRTACISGPGMQTGKSTATARLVPVRQSYPEIVPAVKRAYFELRDVIMSSGKKSMEHRIRKELSSLTARSLGRINKILADGEHLTDECLAKLCEVAADEDFFDEAQKVKRELVKNMLSKGLSPEEIEQEISSALPEMYGEYEQAGRIDRKRWMARQKGTSKGTRTWSQGKKTFGKMQVLKYRPPSVDGSLPELLEIEEIANLLRRFVRETNRVVERMDSEQCDPVQELGRLAVKMNELHSTVLHRGISTKGETHHGTLH